MQRSKLFGCLFGLICLLLVLPLLLAQSLPGASSASASKIVLTQDQYNQLISLSDEYRQTAEALRLERDKLQAELDMLKAPLQLLPTALTESKTALIGVQTNLIDLTNSMPALQVSLQKSSQEIQASRDERWLFGIGGALVVGILWTAKELIGSAISTR